jgi:argininosuccinate synthase
LRSSPIRDLKLSRQEEVDYLAKNAYTTLGKAQYSINKGLWGTSAERNLNFKPSITKRGLPSQLTKEGEKK